VDEQDNGGRAMSEQEWVMLRMGRITTGVVFPEFEHECTETASREIDHSHHAIFHRVTFDIRLMQSADTRVERLL
jgi:hypothetical protein